MRMPFACPVCGHMWQYHNRDSLNHGVILCMLCERICHERVFRKAAPQTYKTTKELVVNPTSILSFHKTTEAEQ